MKYRYFAAAAVAAAFASPAAAQVVPSGGPYIGVIAGVDEVTVDDVHTTITGEFGEGDVPVVGRR